MNKQEVGKVFEVLDHHYRKFVASGEGFQVVVATTPGSPVWVLGIAGELRHVENLREQFGRRGSWMSGTHGPPVRTIRNVLDRIERELRAEFWRTPFPPEFAAVLKNGHHQSPAPAPVEATPTKETTNMETTTTEPVTPAEGSPLNGPTPTPAPTTEDPGFVRTFLGKARGMVTHRYFLYAAGAAVIGYGGWRYRGREAEALAEIQEIAAAEVAQG